MNVQLVGFLENIFICFSKRLRPINYNGPKLKINLLKKKHYNCYTCFGKKLVLLSGSALLGEISIFSGNVSVSTELDPCSSESSKLSRSE